MKKTNKQKSVRNNNRPGIAKFHSGIKIEIFTQYLKGIVGSSGKKTLLDLTFGRGGDLFKYVKAKYTHILGFDIDPKAIDEANRRFRSASAKDSELKKIQLKTVVMDAQSEEVVDVTKEFMKTHRFRNFNTITCLFAIHYFFKSSTMFDKFLHNLTSFGKKNAYLIIMCPDGRKLLELFDAKKTSTPSYSIELKTPSPFSASPFGNMITYKLHTTYFNKVKMDGIMESEGSVEYLVDIDYLVERIVSTGWKLVEKKHFDEFTHIPQHRSLRKDHEKDISYTNVSLVFRKV